MENQEDFNLKLLSIVHSFRPYEEIVIRKSEHGKPGTVIVTARTVTIIEPDGQERADRRK